MVALFQVGREGIIARARALVGRELPQGVPVGLLWGTRLWRLLWACLVRLGPEPQAGHGGILSGRPVGRSGNARDRHRPAGDGRLVADLAGLALADDDDGGHRRRAGAMGL